MTWLGELHDELQRAGIHGGARRRIEAELADHLACDPGSVGRLGSPRAVAEQFAAELRYSRTRRAAWRAFLALALTALLLTVHGRAISPVGPWPGGATATVASLGGLLLVLCAQIAFVAGVLALMRRPTGAAEAALVQRRAAIALLAGAGVVAGEIVQASALEPFVSGPWYAAGIAGAALSLAALAACGWWLISARAVTPRGGPVRGLADDLPGPLRAHATALAVLTGLGVVLLVGAGSTFAERSLDEGLTRGVLEGLAFAGCYVAFRRPLAISVRAGSRSG